GPGPPPPEPALAPFARAAEGRKRADDPGLERRNEAANVRGPALEIEHQVGDPLSRTVVGELPAAAGGEDREPGFEQLLRPRAGAGGVERRMLEKPHELAGVAPRDRVRARIHGRERRRIRDEPLAAAPFPPAPTPAP